MDGRDNSGRAVSAPVRMRPGTPEMRGTGASEPGLMAALNETIKLAIERRTTGEMIARPASSEAALRRQHGAGAAAGGRMRKIQTTFSDQNHRWLAVSRVPARPGYVIGSRLKMPASDNSG
ncbi:MAG TPA: hypothetical protein VFP33_07575 [Gallionella sp.]|nr:hypothetical protein [Gallionella sp.]